jgi:hypothetical protein
MPKKSEPIDIPNPDAPEESEPFYPDDEPDRINVNKEFEGLPREFLIGIILTLRSRVAELEGGGIVIKGWWCFYCSTFNGEEKEIRQDCRHCGKDKKVESLAVRMLRNNPGNGVSE